MIDVEVEVEAWRGAVPDCEAVVERAATAVLGRLASGTDADIVVLLTGDEAVRELNGRFLGKDKPTNVLSFPAGADMAPHLGDIALAFGVCASEAAEQGKPLSHHLSHLVAHGVLHLLGYDHLNDADAEAMESLERDILAGLGVPDPYSWTDTPG